MNIPIITKESLTERSGPELLAEYDESLEERIEEEEAEYKGPSPAKLRAEIIRRLNLQRADECQTGFRLISFKQAQWNAAAGGDRRGMFDLVYQFRHMTPGAAGTRLDIDVKIEMDRELYQPPKEKPIKATVELTLEAATLDDAFNKLAEWFIRGHYALANRDREGMKIPV